MSYEYCVRGCSRMRNEKGRFVDARYFMRIVCVIRNTFHFYRKIFEKIMMECQVCLNTPDGVIFQCLEGHLLCATCNDKLISRKCPTCSVELPAKLPRNRFAENCISEQMISCEYCKESMTRRDLRAHLPCERYENRRKSAVYENRIEYFTGLQGDETLRKITWRNGMTQYFETCKLEKHFGQVNKEIYKMPHPEAGANKEFGYDEIREERDVVRETFNFPHTDAGLFYDYMWECDWNVHIYELPLRIIRTLPHLEAGHNEFYAIWEEDRRLRKEEFIYPHFRNGETLQFFFENIGTDKPISKRYFEHPHIHAGLQLTLFDAGKVRKNLHMTFVEPHKYPDRHFEFATTEDDIECIDLNDVPPNPRC